MGRPLILIGILITIIGVILTFFPLLFSWFGKLPGDIRVEKENGGFYFPITTCILLSVIASLLFRLYSKFF